jgi:16S rRNA (adenine1518-N6/adenine1519-N6)-dimethyltransferase
VGGDTGGSLGAGALRELAERHGVRPKRGLGQHFLIDPNLARAIAADAEVGPGDRVVEIGAGLGSLTRALAEAGADVLAVEVDPALIPALQESVGDLGRVRVLHADATDAEWQELLRDEGWVLAANLPYNVATHLVLTTLRDVPQVERLVVMVQREVGERLVSDPGSKSYGVPSLRVAYRAEGGIVRRVPPSVFWPRPKVESVIVRLVRRSRPPVDVDERRLWIVVDAAFAERRKTIRNALRRLGIEDADVDRAIAAAGIDASVRGEALSLHDFAALVEAVPSEALDRAASASGVRPS